MCLPSPGPRCASHTHKEFVSARESLSDASRTYKASPTPENQAHLETARQKTYEAWVHYTATPAGQCEMIQKINDLEAAGKDASTYQGILDQAQALRSRQMQAHSALRRGSEPAVCKTKVKEVDGTMLHVREHALKQARLKGFDMATIEQTFRSPMRVYPNGRYQGQWRVTGNGICLVGEPRGGRFEVVTMYLDGVVTKPRADQLKTAEGAEFAGRYSTSGGRARAVI